MASKTIILEDREITISAKNTEELIAVLCSLACKCWSAMHYDEEHDFKGIARNSQEYAQTFHDAWTELADVEDDDDIEDILDGDLEDILDNLLGGN